MSIEQALPVPETAPQIAGEILHSAVINAVNILNSDPKIFDRFLIMIQHNPALAPFLRGEANYGLVAIMAGLGAFVGAGIGGIVSEGNSKAIAVGGGIGLVFGLGMGVAVGIPLGK